MSVSSPSPPNTRYHSLDFWRGVACLCIIVFHSFFYMEKAEAGWSRALSTLLAFLWHGVTIFFVISGYCIAAATDSARRRENAVRTYFARRFRRIYPPFWALLALALAAVVGAQLLDYPRLFSDDIHPIRDPFSFSGWQWAGTISLTETWRHHLVGDEPKLLVGHAWTLCYEEQFYAACGIILLLCPRRMFAALGAITAAVACLFVASRGLGFQGRIQGFFFDGYWLIFAFGILVYYRAHRASPGAARLIDWCWCLGAIPAAILFLKLRWDELLSGMAVGFIFAAALSFLHRWDCAIASARWLRPISSCGVMCYSLYLVHWPVSKALSHLLADAGCTGPASTLLITIPACIAASIAAAIPFHVWVERRFLNTPTPILPAAEAISPAARLAKDRGVLELEST